MRKEAIFHLEKVTNTDVTLEVFEIFATSVKMSFDLTSDKYFPDNIRLKMQDGRI